MASSMLERRTEVILSKPNCLEIDGVMIELESLRSIARRQILSLLKRRELTGRDDLYDPEILRVVEHEKSRSRAGLKHSKKK